jgi:PIN domain
MCSALNKRLLPVEQPARATLPSPIVSVAQGANAPDPNAVELAVLDAPVLACGVLTMFLLHLADAGAFDPVWSDQIHIDWTRELQRLRPDIPPERVRRRRLEMDRAFPVANVIASRDAHDEVLAHCTAPAERKSAHVLATALSARAAVIVTDTTFCLAEVMSKLWHDTAILSPDAWCMELLDRREAAVFQGGRAHRASLAHRYGSTDAWLALLREPHVGLVKTADRLAGKRDLL